jgi:hypothetical protein
MKRQNMHTALKTYCAGCLFLLLCAPALSQNWAFELWHEGKVVILEGDTLRGFVKYDLQQDLVQYAIHDQKEEVYTARKVQFFEIFDESVHKYRRFFALPYGNVTGYKSPIFFELLEEGKLTLLAREALEYKTYSSPYNIGSVSRLMLVYKYFFLKENGDIEEFVGNKNDLIDLMGKNGKQVQKYMKTNRLRIEDKSDFSKIVAYYNSLQQTGS